MAYTYSSFRLTKNQNGTFTVGAKNTRTYSVYDDISNSGTDSTSQLGDVSGDTFHSKPTTGNGAQTTGTYIGRTASSGGFVARSSFQSRYYLYTNNNYTNGTTITPTAQPFTLACYVTGTRIRTVAGDVPVESLAIGDRLITASGTERPIRWIGRRAYEGRFANCNPNALPVCFKAGSLSDGVPARDLWVSPEHAMFLDGALIAAELLVNGVSVTKAERVERVEYWHIELESHDVLLAEGAPSESFVDDDSRNVFHNVGEFHDLYPDSRKVPAVYCAPRVDDGYALEAARQRIAARAGLRQAGDGAGRTLIGAVDGFDGIHLSGWAQDPARPQAPVCLDIIVDDDVVAQVYADRFRADLERRGVEGRHGFKIDLSRHLDDVAAHVVDVRRSADGVAVGASLTIDRLGDATPNAVAA